MDAPLILVVDDVPDMRAPLARLLSGRGYRTLQAADGREGLDQLRQHPDTSLILLDLFMPKFDGWAFRQEQLRDPTIAHIPVVVFSVARQMELVQYSLGASAVLHKPMASIDDVLHAVQKCCGPGLDPAPLHAGEKTKWAAGFLRGRTKAFAKGNVPSADVLTAIRLAQQCHVPDDEIRATLAMQRLMWDVASGSVRPLASDADSPSRWPVDLANDRT